MTVQAGEAVSLLCCAYVVLTSVCYADAVIRAVCTSSVCIGPQAGVTPLAMQDKASALPAEGSALLLWWTTCWRQHLEFNGARLGLLRGRFNLSTAHTVAPLW